MAKKTLETILAIVMIPFGLLLVAIGFGIFELVFGSGDQDTWGAIGYLALPAVPLGVVCALLSGAIKRAEDTEVVEPRQAGVPNAAENSPSERAFFTTALIQQIVENDSDQRLFGANLAATDEMLTSYEDADVAWMKVWRAAESKRGTIPPAKELPYWSRRGPDGRSVPVSVLAFWGLESRLRVAKDAQTSLALLRLLSDDNAASVRLSARARL